MLLYIQDCAGSRRLCSYSDFTCRHCHTVHTDSAPSGGVGPANLTSPSSLLGMHKPPAANPMRYSMIRLSVRHCLGDCLPACRITTSRRITICDRDLKSDTGSSVGQVDSGTRPHLGFKVQLSPSSSAYCYSQG